MFTQSKRELSKIRLTKAEHDACRERLETLALKLKHEGRNNDEINKAIGRKVYFGTSMRTGLITSAHIIL